MYSGDHERSLCHLVSWRTKFCVREFHALHHLELEEISVQKVHPTRSAITVILHRDASERRQTTVYAGTTFGGDTLVTGAFKDLLELGIYRGRRKYSCRLDRAFARVGPRSGHPEHALVKIGAGDRLEGRISRSVVGFVLPPAIATDRDSTQGS